MATSESPIQALILIEEGLQKAVNDLSFWSRSPEVRQRLTDLQTIANHLRADQEIARDAAGHQEITRDDLNSLTEQELRAVCGNTAQVAQVYPDEHTARSFLYQVHYHLEHPQEPDDDSIDHTDGVQDPVIYDRPDQG